jgi:hypothetical protein
MGCKEVSSIKELIRMFEDRKNKLSMVLDDGDNMCRQDRKARIMGAIDEIDFLLRTLRQNDSFSANKALGSSETSRSYVFSAEDVEDMCRGNAIIEKNEEMISPQEPVVRDIDSDVRPSNRSENHIPAILRPSFKGPIETTQLDIKISDGVFKQAQEKIEKMRSSADASYDKVQPKDVDIQRSYYIG